MTTLTTEEVLEMARQAGFTSGEVAWHDNMFETFAKLVADKATAREREACAKVCEDFSKTHGLHTKHCVAAAIRARWETTLRGQHDSNT